MKRKNQKFKVRIAEIYSAYFHIEARDEKDAAKIAEEFYKDPRRCDMLNEASHINHTIEVESVD